MCAAIPSVGLSIIASNASSIRVFSMFPPKRSAISSTLDIEEGAETARSSAPSLYSVVGISKRLVCPGFRCTPARSSRLLPPALSSRSSRRPTPSGSRSFNASFTPCAADISLHHGGSLSRLPSVDLRQMCRQLARQEQVVEQYFLVFLQI